MCVCHIKLGSAFSLLKEIIFLYSCLVASWNALRSKIIAELVIKRVASTRDEKSSQLVGVQRSIPSTMHKNP